MSTNTNKKHYDEILNLIMKKAKCNNAKVSLPRKFLKPTGAPLLVKKMS